MDLAFVERIRGSLSVYAPEVVKLWKSAAEAISLPRNLPGKEHDRRLEVRNWLTHMLTEHVRELLMLLPDDAARMDVMIGVAVCIDCGKDNGEMYERRKFYMCSCKDGGEDDG